MLKVHLNNQRQIIGVPRRRLTRLLRLAAPPEWDAAELSVAVVDAEQMKALNRCYTGRQRETDVLAFPLADASDPMVGEVVVCATVAQDEAAARGVPAEDELALYVLHGMLHLLGYDDHTPAARRKMYAREAELLKGAGFRNVRGSRAGLNRRTATR